MRLRLKGVHKVKRKLANGSVRTHYYAWRGGPKIDAKPGTPGFLEQYQEAHKARKKPATTTLDGLIIAYRDSSDFRKLADKTRRDYGRYLDMVRDEFGDMTRDVLEHPEVRGVFKEWRDRMMEHPRSADLAWTVLARVLSWAKDRGKLKVNHCEKGGRVYKPSRSDCVWSEDDIGRMLETASEPVQWALLLALWTGQRQGDLLVLKWRQIQGVAIRFKQGKTGTSVAIPVSGELKAVLGKIRKRGDTILTNSKGEAWTNSGFRASWRKACAKAGVKGLTFHDLRGTAITRLALAGCSVAEIASLTGHSLASVHEILDRHYLGERAKLAESGALKLENANKTVNQTVNRGKIGLQKDG